MKLTITGSQKAFVSGLVTAVATYVGQNGLTYHQLWTVSTLWALVAFILSHQAVYWTTNSNPNLQK